MRIVVSGSSGLIGSALVKRLGADGHEVVRLVRRTPRPGEARWSPADGSIDATALEGADAVVNLAGAGIGDHRWTDDYKRELRNSRLRGTELLATTIAALERPPGVFVSGSAVGYYGASDDEELTEDSPAGDDFLARLCIDWEAAAHAAASPTTRVVTIRTGIVLAKQGGALKKQLLLYKLGLGGRMGSGRQWQSWIALDDEVGAIVHLLRNDISGAVNLTAPTPVTQADFAHTLAHVLHRPAFLPVPAFAPKLVLGGELVDALLLTGQRVLPSVLQASGYTFLHASLEPALRALLAR